MAEPPPTVRYVERAGASVLEVGGSWTVFNLHGLRQKLDSARGAAHGGGQAKASMVDATNVKRLDTAGALEILQLAGGPETEIKAAYGTDIRWYWWATPSAGGSSADRSPPTSPSTGTTTGSWVRRSSASRA